MGNPKQSVNESTGGSRPLEEKQWIRRVREEGDRAAFEKIFRTYYERLHGFAYSYVKRMEDAEDVVQAVLLRVWAQREDWDPPGTLKHYLFAAVRNEALNVLRHQQIADEAAGEVAHIFRQLKSSAYSDKDSEARELQRNIQQGIDQLPSRCRQIFMLSRRSGLTYAEIADVLGVSVNTVGTQMGRALRSLRGHLSDHLHLLAAAELSTMIYQTVFFLFLIFPFTII